MNEENTQSEPVIETPVLSMEPVPESSPVSTEVTPEPIESVPEAPKASAEEQPIPVTETSATTAPVPEQDLSQSISAQPAPEPLTPQAPQPQSLAQQNERGFIRSLLIKAQAKIQFNKQKKLEKIIQFAQKNKIITNDDVQKLLRVSDATAMRYLVKLVQQGHLARAGNPRDAKYQFLR